MSAIVAVHNFRLNTGPAARKNVDFVKGTIPITNPGSSNPWCPVRNAVEVVSYFL